MKEKDLPECSQTCLSCRVSCPVDQCRYWIPYEKEKNCSLVSIYINGSMTLQDVGERLGISFVRVCQIEKKISQKLKTNVNLLKLLEK